MNKFKPLAIEISNRLRRGGISTHIASYSKHDNTVYINLYDKGKDYIGIRISDHPAQLTRRYNVRSDIKQSCKEKNGKVFYNYTVSDISGMILRILKEKGKIENDRLLS